MSEHDCRRGSTRVGALGLFLSALIFAGLCICATSTVNAWQVEPPLIEICDNGIDDDADGLTDCDDGDCGDFAPCLGIPVEICGNGIDDDFDDAVDCADDDCANFAACLLCGDACIFGELVCGVDLDADFPKSACSLTRGSPVDFYTLVVPEGSEQVTINLTAPYDTYLALYDENCVLVELDDDGGAGLNSSITREMPAGTYLVGASSFSSTASGDFVLSASCNEPFNQAALCIDCVVAEADCGGEITGNFPETGCARETSQDIDLYMVEVPPEGGWLLLTLESTEFAPYIELYDEGCFTIGSATGLDIAGFRNAARLNVQVAGGTHFIGVSSDIAQSTGQFTLTVGCRDITPPERICEDCVVGEADCGEGTTGNFPETTCSRETGQELDLYMVDVPPEGGRLLLTLESTEFAPYLQLFDESCISLGTAAAFDGVARLNLEVLGGLHYIGVSGTITPAAGEFTLTVECRETIPPEQICAECQVGEIACDGTAEGVFPESGCLSSRSNATGQQVDIYQFVVEEDLEYVIELTSLDNDGNGASDYDTYLELYDENCIQLALDDDGGMNLNSRLAQYLTAGTYFIGASSYSAAPTATGAYTLGVTCQDPIDRCIDCEVALISCAIPEEGTFPMTECTRNSGQGLDLYSLVIAGGDLTIDLTGDYDTYMQFFDENCGLMASDDDGGDGFNSRLVLADLAAGVYYVGVSSYGQGATGGFSLTATCQSGDNFCVRCRVGEVVPEQAVDGVLGASECTLPPFDQPIEVYSFQVTEPFSGRIAVSSESFDPTVALFNDLCDETAFNDNCGAGSDAACLNVDLKPGSYSIVVSSEDQGAMGDFSLVVLPLTDDNVFSRGDGNGDGVLELTDAIIILNYLFLGGGEPACLEAADSDNDASVSLTDGVLILTYLFRGGNAPALPGPPGVDSGCGPDTDLPGSVGDLGCGTYTGCQ